MTYSDVQNFLKKWKRVRYFSARKYDLLCVWKSSRIYPTLFLLLFIFYAAAIFFYELLLKLNYNYNPFIAAVINAELSGICNAFNILIIICIYLLLAFLIWANRLKNEIIIEQFQEDEEKEQKQIYLNGPLHNLLAYELYRILKLYTDVNKCNPVSNKILVAPVTPVVIKVENVSTILSSVVTEDSVISIGPLKFPARLLLSFFGKFFEGRKIRGSVLFSKNEIIIIASMNGGNCGYNWKVQRPYPPISVKQDETQKNSLQDDENIKGLLVREMIVELAYRIFSDLTEFHSFRWEATTEFMKGLEYYRSCLLAPSEKISGLIDAETAFTRALKEDVTFSAAWYNLGAVYTELKFKDAAKTAFYRSFSGQKDHPEAYYALALNELNSYYEDPQYGTKTTKDWKDTWERRLDDALVFSVHAEKLSKKNWKIRLGEKIISFEILSKADPEIYLLIGRLNLELYYLTSQIENFINYNPNPNTFIDTQVPRKTSHHYLSEALNAFHEAVRYSYREWAALEYQNYTSSALPLRKRLSNEESSMRDTLRTRLGELGWAYIECAANQVDEKLKNDTINSAIVIFSEALFSDPTKLNTYLESPMHQKSKIFLCPSKNNRHNQKSCILSDNEDTQKVEDILPESIFLWKCGVLFLCTGEYTFSKFFIRKSLVQNPKAFLYHASHILVRIVEHNDKKPEKYDIYWWRALQYAITSFDSDENGLDYQWGYIIELINLISKYHPKIYVPSGKKYSFNRADNEIKDWNRVRRHIIECDISKSHEFGAFLISLFSLFEIIMLIKNNEFINQVIDEVKKIEYQENKERTRDSDKKILEIIETRVLISEAEEFEPEELSILNKLIVEFIESHKKWILGEFYLAMGQSQKLYEDFQYAKSWLDTAEKYLTSYEMELGDRHVFAVESKIQSRLKNFRSSLLNAWKAHGIDPTSSIEHQSLALCQFFMEDYSNAHISWSDAELLEPNISEYPADIAAAYYIRARDYPFQASEDISSEKRNEHLNLAFDSLKRSLKIVEYNFQMHAVDPYPLKRQILKDNSLNNLISIHFWMGMVYLKQTKYADGIEKFRLVKNLARPNDSDLPSLLDFKNKSNGGLDSVLIASFHLGITLLEYERIDEAENEFCSLLNYKIHYCIDDKNNDVGITKWECTSLKNINFDKKNIVFKPDFGIDLLCSGISVKEILYDTYIFLTKIFILRSCNIETIEIWLLKIEKLYASMYDVMDENLEFSKCRIDKNLSNLEKIKGLKYLKIERKIDAAIDSLKSAICYRDDPEAHVFLLMALHQKLLVSLPSQNRKTIIDDINKTYNHLKTIGIPQEYLTDVNRVYCDIKYYDIK